MALGLLIFSEGLPLIFPIHLYLRTCIFVFIKVDKVACNDAVQFRSAQCSVKIYIVISVVVVNALKMP